LHRAACSERLVRQSTATIAKLRKYYSANYSTSAADSIVYNALENVEFIVAVDASYTALAPKSV
jgi:hypothetical protein